MVGAIVWLFPVDCSAQVQCPIQNTQFTSSEINWSRRHSFEAIVRQWNKIVSPDQWVAQKQKV
jgi:hypothetical protein